MTKVEALAGEVYRRYGQCPLERFSSGWRVWIRGLHQHYSAASSGGFSAHGSTIREALERLLANAEKYPPRDGQSCRRGCPDHNDWDF